MKVRVPDNSASAMLDAIIKELDDWRGKTLAKIRQIIHQADPEIDEESKWAKATSPGTPVFSHAGIVCTAETYKSVVKMTSPRELRCPTRPACSTPAWKGMSGAPSTSMYATRSMSRP